nr:G protein-coupled receptor [Proales similis]
MDNSTSQDELKNVEFGLDRVMIAIACSTVILLCLIGNGLVVTVVITCNQLKSSTNYILLSLAITDITVSILVMLPATVQDVLQVWVFSDIFCKFYNAFDITCCTASILHLLLVAIDRYIAIFNPLKYENLTGRYVILVQIVFVWTLSLSLSFIPIFLGWNLNEQGPLDLSSKLCLLEANLPYAIISSSLSFYIPFIIMAIVYYKIYVVARRQADAIAQLNVNSRVPSSVNLNRVLNEETISQEKKASISEKSQSRSRLSRAIEQLRVIERRKTKDTKAIKTLGIIMGIFLICWLPFFIMYLFGSLTGMAVPHSVERLITWIGYVNSFINPIVYALTNRDFRKAYLSTLDTIAHRATCRKTPSSNDRRNESGRSTWRFCSNASRSGQFIDRLEEENRPLEVLRLESIPQGV